MARTGLFWRRRRIVPVEYIASRVGVSKTTVLRKVREYSLLHDNNVSVIKVGNIILVSAPRRSLEKMINYLRQHTRSKTRKRRRRRRKR